MGKVSLRPIITCIFLAVLFYTARCTNPELASVKEESLKGESGIAELGKGAGSVRIQGQGSKRGVMTKGGLE